MPDTLSRLAQLQRVAALLEQQHYLQQWGTSLDVGVRDGEPTVGIHGCTPDELEAAIVGLPDVTVRRDEYRHARWVEVMLDGIEVTLYHR